ncbi:hypothetical protein LA080_010550 [Diaporthe eres]|nr:hypothetical protein LA080_010550 [Diaporthe eres]
MESLISRSSDRRSSPITIAEASSYVEAGSEPARGAFTSINETLGASLSKPLSIRGDEQEETTKDVPLSRKRTTAIAVIFLLSTIAFAVASGLLKSSGKRLTRSYSDHFDPGCIDKLGESGSPAIEQAFDLDLTFGNFTFTHAKLIDVAWDTTIGQGGRLLHGWILYRCVMRRLLIDAMEYYCVTYKYYLTISWSRASFESLCVIITDLVSMQGIASFWCSAARLRSQLHPSVFILMEHRNGLLYTSGGWKVDSTTTIWDHFRLNSGTNSIKQSSHNFQSIRAYAITRQLLQISLNPEGWVTHGPEAALPTEVVEQDGIRPSLYAAQIVPPQAPPVPAGSLSVLDVGAPEDLSWGHFFLGNVSGEVLPPGEVPYNSTIWVNSSMIKLPAPFVDVGHGCSGNTVFGSLGNCICYKGQPISLDLLGEGRAICNTAPGYVWGFSSFLLRLGLALEAAWMACCLICYLWLWLRGGLVKKRTMTNAGPMKFALEFSEAVREIEDNAAELSEDRLKARLKAINVGYRTESVTGEHEGLRHRVVAGLEREQGLIDLTDARISQFEAELRGWIDETWRKRKPTDSEVYEDLNWHVYERPDLHNGICGLDALGQASSPQADLNPRFCINHRTAVDLLTQGGQVDCLYFMGAFSHVVYMARFSNVGAILVKNTSTEA